MSVAPTPPGANGERARRDGPLVFVSYSRDDIDWQRRFRVLLNPLAGERRIGVWADEHIEVGGQWRREIDEAVARTTMALLLVSGDFLDSTFIMKEELPALRARAVRLVCVLIEDCLWEYVPELAELQWAHDPERDGPLAREGMTVRQRDKEIVRICRRLAEWLPQATDPRPAEARPSQPAAAEATVGRAVAELGPALALGALTGVPREPPGYIEREEVEQLRAVLLGSAGSAMGITGEARALGLHGQGGIGKSVLAAALARDAEVRRHFPDGIHWVTVGESADLVRSQVDLLTRLGRTGAPVRTLTEGRDLLRGALAESRSLLVVDDVWSAAAASAFLVTGPGGRVLFTTRDSAVLDAVGARVEHVDVLSPAAARVLLARLARTPVERLPAAEIDRILEATDRVALALALVGAAVGQGGRSWGSVAAELDRGTDVFLDHPYANTFKSMQVGMSALDDELAHAYRTLALYPEDTAVPVAAIARFWAHLWGISAEQTAAWVASLAARELFAYAGESITFHDLQREFLLLEAEDLALLHADLLDAYRNLIAGGRDGWWRLPPDEPYIWDHLLHHLRGARDFAAIAAVASDLGFLTVRMSLGGRHAVEADLREAAALHPGHEGVEWCLRLFTQWGHVFEEAEDVAELSAAVASRSHDAPEAVDRAGVGEMLPPCHIVPRTPLPAAPSALARVLDRQAFGLALSPDDRLVAAAGWPVRLWSVATGELRRSLEDVNGRAVAFSGDGTKLAIGTFGSTVSVLDVRTDDMVAFECQHRGAQEIAVSSDGSVIALANDDGAVWLCDVGRRRVIGSLDARPRRPRHALRQIRLSLSPDGRVLAIGDETGRLRLVDTGTAKVTGTLRRRLLDHIRPGAGTEIEALAFMTDDRLRSIDANEEVRTWDLRRRRLLRGSGKLGSYLRSAAFSADARLVACASWDGVVVRDAETGEALGRVAEPSLVRRAALSRDARLVVTAGSDEKVCVWDLTAETADARDGRRLSVEDISPDGRFALARGGSLDFGVWDLADGTESGAAPAGARLLSAAATIVLAVNPDADVSLRELGTGRLVGRVRVPAGARPVALRPDGAVVATMDSSYAVSLWDVHSGEAERTLAAPAHDAFRQEATFSPDGRWLAVVESDGRIVLWDTATDARRSVGDERPFFGRGSTFSHDARLFAATSTSGVVVIDVETGRAVTDLAVRAPQGGRSLGIGPLAFSAGDRLVATGANEAVEVFDVSDGASRARLPLGFDIRHLVWGEWGITAITDAQLIQLRLVDDSGGRSPG